MASTASGWQYPQSGDSLPAYPPVAQSVATKLEGAIAGLRMASGSVTFPGAVTTAETVAVTFPAGRFTAAPYVVPGNYSSDPVARNVSAASATASGVNLVGVKTAGGSWAAHWIAVGA